MATSVIMPGLEMAQETGLLVSWLKRDGESVEKAERLIEFETDKVTVEIEAPASGFLGGITANECDVIPVAQTIAWILAAGEKPPDSTSKSQSGRVSTIAPQNISVEISPVARKMAEDQGIDLTLVKSNGKRIEKADVLAYIASTRQTQPKPASASPKARRLASERGIDITTIKGSGPEGAVLVDDVHREAETVS